MSKVFFEEVGKSNWMQLVMCAGNRSTAQCAYQVIYFLHIN